MSKEGSSTSSERSLHHTQVFVKYILPILLLTGAGAVALDWIGQSTAALEAPARNEATAQSASPGQPRRLACGIVTNGDYWATVTQLANGDTSTLNQVSLAMRVNGEWYELIGTNVDVANAVHEKGWPAYLPNATACISDEMFRPRERRIGQPIQSIVVSQ